MQKYDEPTVQQALQKLPEWQREDEKWISCRYRFSSFVESLSFVNEVGRIAEEMKHHPMISIDYRVVTVRLTTWKAGGLTELDFEAAAKYDDCYEQ